MTKNGLDQYNRAIAEIALAAASAGSAVAQTHSTRQIEVTVTESSARFVTGLEREDFEIVENGVRRAITRFSAAGLPLSLAIVSRQPLPMLDMPRAADDLMQPASLFDALRQLGAAPNSRKRIAITAEDPMAIPSEIELATADPDCVAKAVVELRNQDRLELEFDTPSPNVQVVVIERRAASSERELEVIA